jgi:predicted transcriptional regulator of viral defense system
MKSMATEGKGVRTPRNPESVRRLGAYVDGLQASGRYTFRREEAQRALRVSTPAFRKAAWRLLGKGRLLMPRRGFLVIVPMEYRTAGGPPPSWFIDDLMRFHEHPYYIGGLSAAALHGAAHHQPMEFQVVSDIPFRPIRCGRARIRFFSKKHLVPTPTADVKTPTGTMKVSTPEATALDLLRYVHGAGGLGNVATVLSELAEVIRPDALTGVAKREAEPAYVQRLGYLLDLVGAGNKAKALGKWISEKEPTPVPLSPGKPSRGFPLDSRWRVIINEKIEAET